MVKNWDSIWLLVDEMGAKRVKKFDISLPPPKSIVIQEGLSKGVDINLEDLDDEISVGGLLSYKGRQVLVYIPDQGSSVASVLRNPESGKRFHVCNCATLKSMHANNKDSRYVATNDTSGIFELTNWTGTEKARGALTVCRNCLRQLNYQDYLGRYKERTQIYKSFNLTEFFSTYSSLFKYKYAQSSEVGYQARQYQVQENPAVWSVVSAPLACSSCHVTLVGNVKSAEGNGEFDGVLCGDCHRRQHWSIAEPVLLDKMQEITRERRKQGILDSVVSWDDALALADPAYHGLMKIYERQGYDVPEVGYPLTDSNGVVLDLEIPLAWEISKHGVVATLDEKERCSSLGWNVITLGEAMIDSREDS